MRAAEQISIRPHLAGLRFPSGSRAQWSLHRIQSQRTWSLLWNEHRKRSAPWAMKTSVFGRRSPGPTGHVKSAGNRPCSLTVPGLKYGTKFLCCANPARIIATLNDRPRIPRGTAYVGATCPWRPEHIPPGNRPGRFTGTAIPTNNYSLHGMRHGGKTREPPSQTKDTDACGRALTAVGG